MEKEKSSQYSSQTSGFLSYERPQYFAEKAIMQLLKFSNGLQTEFYDQSGQFCSDN